MKVICAGGGALHRAAKGAKFPREFYNFFLTGFSVSAILNVLNTGFSRTGG
jgi:hypothetical protein